MRFEISLTVLQQKALAIALALVPILALVALVISFISAEITHYGHTNLLVKELTRERALLEEAPHWNDQLANVKNAFLWHKLFLTAVSPDNPPTNHLAGIITKAGGKIEQNAAKLVDAEGATQVEETAIFTGDITTLTHVLEALRTSGPLFVIHRLSIRDQETPLTAPRTAPNALHIELTVTGFARPS